jgi:ADP-heptose:LPS heptosyltransferase
VKIKKLIKRAVKGIINIAGNIFFFKRKKTLAALDVKKILVISLYFSGDYLFHTPAIEILKKLYPSAKIDLWTKSRNAELAENSFLNEVLVFDNVETADYNDNKNLDLGGKFGFLKKLRSRNYDIIIDLTGKYSTGLFTYFAGAKYTAGINYNAFGFCYDKFVDLNTSTAPGHLMEKYISVIRKGLGIDNTRWIGLTENLPLRPHIYISENEKGKVQDVLAKLNINNDKPLIILHTTAGWAAKEWSPKNFSRLIEQLEKRNYNYVFIGGKRDEENFHRIISNADIRNKEDIFKRFLKLKFLETAELIRRSDVFIGSDSAPLHIAGAVDTASIGLFGPTNPLFSNPIGSRHKYIYHELYCSAPIDHQYCTRNGGRTCTTVECMQLIEVSQVLNLTEELINAGRPKTY